jgi:UDPglucose 6-dehydrogenase
MKIGIIGVGHVGGSMAELFKEAVLYDPFKNLGTQEEINLCEISFICVPTPQAEDGSCDTHIVEEVLRWVKTPTVVIRSTVPVGFTDEWNLNLPPWQHLVFQPEYYGETVAHPFADPHNRPWITLGGDYMGCRCAARAYKTVFTSELIINIVSTKTAELAKYMENAFYATKVTFCNQFYQLAENMGVDYDKLRETWLHDPRISRDHTFVYEDNRGYGGSCLPKDMSSIIFQGEMLGTDVDFLKSVAESNNKFKKLNI